MTDQHREHPLPWAADGAITPPAEPADPPASGGEDETRGETRGNEDQAAPAAPQPAPVPYTLPAYEDLFAIPVAEPQATADEPTGDLPTAAEPTGAEADAEAEELSAAEDGAEEPVEQTGIEAALARRRDPRDRPPDPAGTQPKFDPESLLPKHREEPALVSYATEIGEGEDLDLEEADESSDLLPARRGAGGVGAPVAPPAPVPYAPRFQFIKGALGALGVVAIAVLVLVLTGSSGGHGTTSRWSAWKPADNGVDPAIQIANHVAPEYRQADGKQIVNVTGGPPAYQGQSLVLALLQSGQQPSELTGNAVLYQLCGNGANCTIKGGTPSAQRGLLLRREALELALYTFHYLPGVNEVVVTIPPAPSTSTDKSGQSTSLSTGVNRALFFRPSTVSGELSQNLNRTLPPPTPTVTGMDDSRNADLVANVTSKALYDFSIVQGSQTYVLVLQPPSIGG